MVFVPEDGSGTEGVQWWSGNPDAVRLAFTLLPLAGITFLWFIGVVRDLLGELEDQLFSTVFFGSGLLFLAMMFSAASVAGGIITTASIATDEMTASGIYLFGGSVVHMIMKVYAVRMAGVFMISLGTISVRAGIMPRSLIWLTYGLALIFLLTINATKWLILIFPAWVAIISVYILIVNHRRAAAEKAMEASQAASNVAVSSEP